MKITPQQVINEKAKNSIFRFLAMDSSGYWFYYQDKPEISDIISGWLPVGNDKIEACNENIIYNGGWEQSLHEAHS